MDLRTHTRNLNELVQKIIPLITLPREALNPVDCNLVHLSDYQWGLVCVSVNNKLIANYDYISGPPYIEWVAGTVLAYVRELDMFPWLSLKKVQYAHNHLLWTYCDVEGFIGDSNAWTNYTLQ
jgi:hypothetical protein